MDERQVSRGEYLLRLDAEDPDRPSEFELLGRTWALEPGVFSPSYTNSTELLTSWIPYPVDGSFLEVGSGAGVTAVTAALAGCATVTALDISAAAVANTRRNAELQGVADRVEVAQSDLFDALEPGDRFDLIFWNSNYIETDPGATNETELHHALFDPGFETHRRFLAEAPKHLTAAGRVLLGFSDIGSWAALSALCDEFGAAIEIVRAERRQQNQPVEFQLLEIVGLGAPGAPRRDDLRDALLASSDLAGLHAGIADLLPHAERVELAAGEVLFEEGDEALALYIVEAGSVQVLVTGSDGSELILRKLGPGKVLGEQAALAPAAGRRAATVRAAERAALVRIDRAAFAHDASGAGEMHARLHEIADGYAVDRALRRSALGALVKPDPDAAERFVPAGEVLFHQGDEADRVYLIASGTAAVYKERGERRELVGRVMAGRCVGELALVRRARRSATVIAETDLRLVEVDGASFVELLESSPALREHMQALERVYRLPARGVITQHTGQVDGEDAITTLYHLADGRSFAASRIVGRDLYHLERVEPPLTDGRTLSRGDVKLTLDDDGAIARIAAAGDSPQLPAAHLLAIDGVILTEARRNAFERDGELPEAGADPAAMLCSCVHVTTGAVDDAIRGGCSTIAELTQALACGSVCGGCTPRLARRLAEAAWHPVEVVSEVHLTDTVRAVRLLPTAGRARRWRAGQHVVVAAGIDAHQVERRYTLTGTPGDPEYEITVKREPLGRFSNWLFDERRPEDRLRVSHPQGEPVWQLGEEPALCFVAGIGVTPVVAACRALGEATPLAPIHVDASAGRAQDLPYLDELRRCAGVTVALRETAEVGRLTAADVRELVALHAGARVYVCGPPGYIRDVSLYLRTAGVPTDRLHVEVFAHAGGPPEAAREPAPAPEPRAAGHLDGTSDYETFVRTTELLALQVSAEDWAHPDELLFQVVHQASELWLKLAVSELGRAAEHLAAREPAPALRLLRRAIECMKNTTDALDMLEQMSPWEYHDVRRSLGQGSGFDSPGFCGVRDVSPQLGALFDRLRDDAGLSLLEVYTRGREFEDLYQLAELLTEWDERCTMWRMRHLKVVERILGGGATGTQGTPVAVLADLIHTRFYPELWQVRDELTARSELEPLPLRPDART